MLTAGVDLPLRAIREQIASAFDLLVQISRLVDGSRRVTHITEVLRMESDVITLQDLFHAKPPDEDSAVDTRGGRLLAPLSCTRPEAALPREDGRQRRAPAAHLLPRGRPRRAAHVRCSALRRRVEMRKVFVALSRARGDRTGHLGGRRAAHLRGRRQCVSGGAGDARDARGRSHAPRG